jgi:hypothetical protein
LSGHPERRPGRDLRLGATRLGSDRDRATLTQRTVNALPGSGPDPLHEVFLPYTADELLPHFVLFDPDGENPEKFLTKWHKRIDEAPSKDPSWLQRDETLWTANALMAIQQKAECADR